MSVNEIDSLARPLAWLIQADFQVWQMDVRSVNYSRHQNVLLFKKSYLMFLIYIKSLITLASPRRIIIQKRLYITYTSDSHRIKKTVSTLSQNEIFICIAIYGICTRPHFT